MLVRQADGRRMTEAFGIYALAGKATSFLAPFSIAFMTDLTGSQRIGVTPVLLLFLIGLVVMAWVRADGEDGEPSDRIASTEPGRPKGEKTHR